MLNIKDIFVTFGKIMTKMVIICLVFVLLVTNTFVADAYASFQGDLKSIYDDTTGYDPESGCNTGGTATQLPGDDNIAKVFNYLVSKGFADFQAAGIIGNMVSESGVEPRRLQGVFTDADEQEAFELNYVTQVTPGDGGLVNGEDINVDYLDELNQRTGSDRVAIGYGLVQWTAPGKMVRPAIEAGKVPGEIQVQLDHLLEEMTDPYYNDIIERIKATTDVAAATVIFEDDFENHAGALQPERIVKAEEILAQARAGGMSAGSLTGGAAPEKVYVLGDSITARSATRYVEEFTAKGSEVTISARVGRSWTGEGQEDSANTGSQGTGQAALTADTDTVATANAIVVALGTNGLTSGNPVDEILSAIKAINETAVIYWVNVANSTLDEAGATDLTTFNTTLDTKQTENVIRVIPWDETVDPGGNGTGNPNGILDAADGIHPSIPEGVDALVNLTVNAVVNGGAPTTTDAGSGDCACSTEDEEGTQSQNLNNLRQGIQASIDASGLSISVSVDSQADDNTDLSINGSDSRLTRSTYKVYVAYALLKGVEDGSVTWDATVETDFNNMIINSDNDAARRLAVLAGGEAAITTLLRGAGLSNNTDMKSFGDESNLSTSTSTSDDFAKFLSKLHSKGLPGLTDTVNYDRITNAMTAQTAELRGIPAGVSAGSVANKPGWGGTGADAATNDVAIVTGGSTYTIAILTNGDGSWATVAEITGKIASTMESPQGSGSDCGSTAGQGNIVATVLEYAWPNYTPSGSPGASTPKPEYAQAITKAVEEGRYVGANGIDCGGFITTAMLDSGFENGYNSNGRGGPTGIQRDWVMQNWSEIGVVSSSAELQPGDVAFEVYNDGSDAGHTFMWIGEQPGFEYPVASAAQGDRAPMAGAESISDPYRGDKIVWYRKR